MGFTVYITGDMHGDLERLYDKGIRHLFLDEVLVTAPRKEPKTEYEKFPMSQSIKEEDIAQSGAIDMSTLMQQKIASLQFGKLIDDEENEIVEGDIVAQCKIIKIIKVTEVSNHYE